MTITEILSRIKKLEELIEEAEEDKKRLREKAEECTSQLNSDNTKSVNEKNKSEINMLNYSQKCIEIVKLYDELEAMKISLEVQIGRISNVRHRRIFKYIYIDRLTTRQVAKKLGYNHDYFRCQLLPKLKTKYV